MTKTILTLALVTLLVPAAIPARSDDNDHARARAALAAGQVVPLETITAAAKTLTGGTILDVELEDADDEDRHHQSTDIVYELKVLVPGGRIVKLEYDARTGALLSNKTKH